MSTTQKTLGAAGFNACFNILQKWQCSTAQMHTILGLTTRQYNRAKRCPISVNFNRDQLERMSLILNIHSVLRTIFTNPKNIYGFIKMDNHNPFFSGQSPLALIEQGSLITLYHVYKHIEVLKTNQSKIGP